MKTGTPPRVDGRSLDFSKMIIQPGDDVPEKFSAVLSIVNGVPFVSTPAEVSLTATMCTL